MFLHIPPLYIPLFHLFIMIINNDYNLLKYNVLSLKYNLYNVFTHPPSIYLCFVVLRYYVKLFGYQYIKTNQFLRPFSLVLRRFSKK